MRYASPDGSHAGFGGGGGGEAVESPGDDRELGEDENGADEDAPEGVDGSASASATGGAWAASPIAATGALAHARGGYIPAGCGRQGIQPRSGKPFSRTRMTVCDSGW